MLDEAVVIASDGTGADVGLAPDFRVAEVGKMRGFAAFTERAFLKLDEIADARASEKMRLRAKPGERTDDHFGFDAAFGENAMRLDNDILAENHVVEDAAGADGAAGADFRLPGGGAAGFW